MKIRLSFAFAMLLASSFASFAQQPKHDFSNEGFSILLGLLIWIGIPVGLYLLIKHTPRASPEEDAPTSLDEAGSPRFGANSAGSEHSVRDTENAIEDLRLARSYIDDWYNGKGGSSLTFAARYIEQARSKDPDARLTVESEKSKNLTYSADDLAGEALYLEACSYAADRSNLNGLQRARDILERAISYAPHSVQYRDKLAHVLLDLHDKDSAVRIAQDAVSAAPPSVRVEARKLLDRVEAAPRTEKPFPLAPSTMFILGTVALVILAFVNLFSGEFSTFFSLIFFAFITGGISSYLLNKETFQKAMDGQARKRADL